MCGIFCSIASDCDNAFLELCAACQQQVKQRGPEAYSSFELKTDTYQITLAASVLWLQGQSPIKQPLKTDYSVFVYNGDIFDYADNSGAGVKLLSGDTKFFLNQLETGPSIIESLVPLKGPFAFIWFNKEESVIYFGRDIYGRRSLLLGYDVISGNTIITSVAKRSNFKFIELPAIGIFAYDLRDKIMSLFIWPNQSCNDFDEKFSAVCMHLQCSIHVKQLQQKLTPTVQVPVSRGPEFLHNIIGKSADESFEYLLHIENWFQNVNKLEQMLKNALKQRITVQPTFCKNCIVDQIGCNHCKVGILFSGGVDCTILALLSELFIPPETPIDLINVAFSNTDNFSTPDRITGLKSLEELRRLRPKRAWNFLEIDIPYNELETTRNNVIADLIFPLNTILDDSLGCALWFAAKGETQHYITPCRVLLVGMGADELFGGYTRHRSAFKRLGWKGLQQVLDQDWRDISHRNLARDDRVVSDHGRQLRTPYLDEHFVNYVRALDVWDKTFPSEKVDQGIGEKILLRTLAYSLGLKETATFKKRALQFGSRIANKKEKAHQVSVRLIK